MNRSYIYQHLQMFGQSIQMCRTGSTEKRCCRLGLFGNGEHGQHGEQERGRATAYGTPLRSYRSPVGERLPCEQRQKSTGPPPAGLPWKSGHHNVWTF